MTASEMIESGYLEAYILGALSEQENLLVEEWLQNNAVKAKIAQLEADLLRFAADEAISPPENVRRRFRTD